MTRTLAVAVLATAHCLTLTACGKRAMLARPPVVNNSGPGTPPPSAPSELNQKKQNPAPKYDFAASLKRVTWDVQQKTVQVNFVHTGSAGATDEQRLPMTTTLEAAAAKDGAELNTDPLKPGYSGHLTCEDPACTQASLLLTELKSSSKASIKLTRVADLRGTEPRLAGTPKDLQAKALTVLSPANAPGATLRGQTAKVEGGSTFFKVDCELPTPADRTVTLSGILGKETSVVLAYGEKQSGPLVVDHTDIDGSASIDTAGNLLIEFAGTNDRIQSMSFGEFRTK